MLRNFWYALAFASEIGARPRLVRALGEDLVVWRARDGRPAVLSNQCVHRGGSLADGEVVDGCVRCPYHGWRFDAAGACVAIPAAPPTLPIPKKARVAAYDAVERYGLVWAFLGELPAAERPPIPDFPEYDAAGWRAIHGDFTWRANYERVVENAVDIAHTPFVHRRSFGNYDRPEIDDYDVEHGEFSVATTVRLEAPRPRGLWSLVRKERAPVTASVAVHLPNVTRLELDLGRWRTVLVDYNLPVDETTTRTLWIQSRNFFTGRWADRDARRRVLAIFREDQPIVEAQRPALVPADPAAELHVKSDAMSIAYRSLRRRFAESPRQRPSATSWS